VKISNKFKGTLGVLIFSAGILLGLYLFGAIVWEDLEASLFDTSTKGKEELSTLRCPVMITSEETGTVKAVFKNTLDRPVEFYIRAHTSEGFVTLFREEISKLPVAAGESETVEWSVTADDAAYGRLILFRVHLAAKYPLPARHGTCGIMVVDWPLLSGNQVFALLVILSVLGVAAGVALWVSANRPMRGLGRDVIRAMAALAGSVLVGIILGLTGQWMIGAVVLVITVLLVGTAIGYFVNRG